jgi:hypothetical protein
MIESTSLPAPKAAVGGNPNIAQLMAGTANACSPAGCDSAPPVAVGLILKDAAQGTPLPGGILPAGTKGYLVVALDVDFRATDLMLSAVENHQGGQVAPHAGWNPLSVIQVTSWTSNGIRDQNLLAETGVPGVAFDITSLRRFGFDTAPTAARQQIVIEVTNTSPAGVGALSQDVYLTGLVSGVCGDCNTTKRGQ